MLTILLNLSNLKQYLYIIYFGFIIKMKKGNKIKYACVPLPRLMRALGSEWCQCVTARSDCYSCAHGPGTAGGDAHDSAAR